MKRLNDGINIVLLVCLFIVSGCASSGSTSQEISTESDYSVNYWTLEDFLRRASGVQIIDRGGELQVTIRGNNSIGNPGNQPLYVVDGQKAGRSFSQVSGMFSRGEIISVEILPAGAASQYGMEGNYGVIVINSSRSS